MVCRKRHKTAAALAFVFLLTAACAAFAQAPQRDTRSAMIYYNDAMKWYFSGDSSRAVLMLTQSLTSDPLFVPAHERLQDILMFRGKGDSLRTVYAEFSERQPDSPEYMYLRARALDDEEQVVEGFRSTVELDSMFYWGYAGLGHHYLDRGFYEDAAREFQKAVNVNPALADAQYGLGIAYYRMGDHERGIRQFEKAVLISPRTMPEANFLLGLTYWSMQDTTRTIGYLTDYLQTVHVGPEHDFASSHVDSLNAAIKRQRLLAEEAAKAAEAEKKKKKKSGVSPK